MTRTRCEAIAAAYPAVAVVRTWRKDGSTNVLPLAAAVDNLIFRGIDTARQSPATIAQRLILGEYVETRLAVFRVQANGGWE